MVAFLLFVRPAIRAAMKFEPPFEFAPARARLDAPLESRGDRRSYLRARLRWRDGVLSGKPVEISQARSVLWSKAITQS